MATIQVTPDLDAVVSEIHIAAPPNRIFHALTDAGELARWFSGPECPVKTWQMDARLGGRYSYSIQKPSVDGSGPRTLQCHGDILEYDPPRLLVYTWIANWHDQTDVHSVVRWDLTPTQHGTQVKVTHSGLATMPVARKEYSGGWSGVVEMLKKFVESSD